MNTNEDLRTFKNGVLIWATGDSNNNLVINKIGSEKGTEFVEEIIEEEETTNKEEKQIINGKDNDKETIKETETDKRENNITETYKEEKNITEINKEKEKLDQESNGNKNNSIPICLLFLLIIFVV